ncbi:MAG: hypothetical protein ACR2G6_00660 [Gemmatimonadaceae bacterium]
MSDKAVLLAGFLVSIVFVSLTAAMWRLRKHAAQRRKPSTE